MSRSVQKKLYIAGVVATILLSLYIIFKLIVSPVWVKAVVLISGLVYKFVPQVKIPVKAIVNKWYFSLVYENSIFWELFYDLTCVLFPSTQINQINYGFAPLNKDGVLIELNKQDEPERMSLQLYWRTATCLGTRPDLKDLVILEVSSGRGGGLDFLTRNYALKKAIGLDISANNIKWCRQTYEKNEKLEFVLGNAETFVDDGTLPPDSIDVVISVDSAHLYPHFDMFINQCKRVLKKGGYLCISDFMDKDKFPVKEDLMNKETGLTLIKREETTPNILHAMDIDGERRKKMVEQLAHPLLKAYFKWQTGAKGSRIYNLLKSGNFSGAGWVFQKN